MTHGALSCADRERRLSLLRAIEEVSVRFWPAHEVEAIGGWLWRYSNGGSQRANSVATLGNPGADLDRAIDTVEHLYRKRAAPSQFQITEVRVPLSLDSRLAARGYLVCDPCTTLVRKIGAPNASDAEARPALCIERDPKTDWLDTYAGVITDDRRAQAKTILDRVPMPRAFIGLKRHGVMVATALCVVAGEIARVKCVATRASARRSGAAEVVMRGSFDWATARGARTVALGVSVANAPAQALYAKLGFATAGFYHIRAKRL